MTTETKQMTRVKVGDRTVLVVQNPIEEHLNAIRNEYVRLTQETGASQLIIQRQAAEIEQLRDQLSVYQARYEAAESKIESIKGQL